MQDPDDNPLLRRSAAAKPVGFGPTRIPKVIVGFAGVVALMALGVAVRQMRRANAATEALIALERERAAGHARFTDAESKLRQAQTRAAEAERDSGELLKAIDALRAQQAAARAASGGSTTPASIADEHLSHERRFQQDLAKRRAEEAIKRANLDQEAASLDTLSKFNRLI